ncbi:Krueppel-like factor 4 [Sciurus carolinensis]|uniref:Krueppel-like factor 4 n=1 Tax=Sciurus carolinensis TaxID=30640 RepID=A0AA41SZC2_SCICA|nr:Krueppel-like factor 4 [Sciurus carolinensis]
MRPPPGESDTAVSDALLPSFSTFASGSAGRERTLCPAGAPNNRWREELSRVKRLPPVPPGRAYDLAAAAVATDLESGGASAACVVATALLPRRETEKHQESVAPTASSWASVSASSFLSCSGPASAPSTCCFSCQFPAGGDSGVTPGGTSGGLLYGRESAPPPRLPSTWRT